MGLNANNARAINNRSPIVESRAFHKAAVGRRSLWRQSAHTLSVRAKADPRHWGLVGDLAKVREDLVEAARYLSGMETADIHRFLSDAT